MRPGKQITATVPEGTELQITKATLGPNAKKGQRAVLYARQDPDDGPDMPICALNMRGSETASIDLPVADDERVFYVKGDAEVHLTGYTIEVDDEDDDEDDDETPWEPPTGGIPAKSAFAPAPEDGRGSPRLLALCASRARRPCPDR